MRRSIHAFVLGAICGAACAAPRRSSVPAATIPSSDAPALQRSKSYAYRELADAIGVREGIDAGMIDDGDTMIFIASDPATGRILPDAKLEIGEGPDARIIDADEEGRVAFPLELALVERNPMVTLLADVDSPQLTFDGTLHIECDHTSGGGTVGRRQLEAADYEGLKRQDAGPDRVYALDDDVTAAQRAAMAAQLTRLRTAYTAVTGWEPPAMAVLLASSDHRELAPSPDRDGRRVWALGVSEIELRDRSTAFLAHEWTHASLAHYAPQSGAGEPASRWIEDGLCELVAAHVERTMFPDEPSVTVTGRAANLESDREEVPAEVDLRSFASGATSMYGQMAAMCAAGTVYGYAYALAFWEAADLDAPHLRELLTKLRTSTLIEQAEQHAPPGLMDLKLERACAVALLHGDRECAMK